ncbi:CaiB/BaiF CoA transferase family protein [Castellaniella sp.]|uniref:CaiB/BaiF CoA transferase family protein n=1 Tax=Castellaniella sp. TaxID=1955812 RepID=UPI00355F3ECF
MSRNDAPSTPHDARHDALAGIRVLDLSRVLAGPWCTQNLADLGADVIKIEKPGEGDDTRHWGPPYFPDAQGRPTDQGCYFASCNRNKRSVTVNIASQEGQQIIRDLARESDILVENFKVGNLARYGLDYASLAADNPRLIYCSITGFGQTGPFAGRAGYDLLIQAMSGMMSITGRGDDEPGGGPVRVGVAITDLMSGMYATIAILAALEMRHRTGRGQYIDTSLLDVGMAMLANQASGFLNTGEVPPRLGNVHMSLSPYQDFPTADGRVLMGIANDGQFTRFCQAVGVDWMHDERFRSNAVRVENRPVLVALMSELLRTRTTAEWVELFQDKAVPCGPINDIGTAFENRQVHARGLRISQERYPDGAVPEGEIINEIVGVASPLRLSDAPARLRHAPPALGQHTDEVLRERLDLTPAALQALRARGVL